MTLPPGAPGWGRRSEAKRLARRPDGARAGATGRRSCGLVLGLLFLPGACPLIQTGCGVGVSSSAKLDSADCRRPCSRAGGGSGWWARPAVWTRLGEDPDQGCVAQEKNPSGSRSVCVPLISRRGAMGGKASRERCRLVPGPAGENSTPLPSAGSAVHSSRAGHPRGWDSLQRMLDRPTAGNGGAVDVSATLSDGISVRCPPHRSPSTHHRTSMLSRTEINVYSNSMWALHLIGSTTLLSCQLTSLS